MKKLCILLLSMWLALPIGCTNVSKFVTGACGFIVPYTTSVNTAFDEIQKDYPIYAAIVSGKTNASMSEVSQARAWIAAADISLGILGAVIANACETIKIEDVQKALHIANETLPKTKLPEDAVLKTVIKSN